ncbi:non-hydrolyzing UDP-N-acetylglucosamine 2-epimerase [Methanolobus halotolerans]|uniref:UDP-N-acetylglucosamine 2-epimerase (Non-hydrolyzing) n=1 Tax=Methanolobus halotolerans TaxID=2052935 RepID=A0A4E0PU49_9EURY|nr:UDP-N-acetylglucosamine 2-epimerase (non-hydrolyzing) [Methanolobus halotolerans]TGC08303.1 UDP-N-acetylglucosamine 2-epimerase (non-hydrolyzing) [Methanolobus halotolerans]
MKIAIILGTRPEIIKMSPLIRECEKLGIDHYILHTGQHYSFEMDKVFFDDLKLPVPRYNLDVGSGTHGQQTGRMLQGIEEVLIKDRPDVLLVQGDTNTVLAGALAGSKLNIRIGHVEAGLRSFDRTMPEEINRIIADHISDYLFAPTENSKEYLLAEGIPKEKIFVTGNTVVDAVYQNLEISKQTRHTLSKLNLKEGEYFLTTVHRAENTDKKERLSRILAGFEQIYQTFRLPIIFPAHPRTVKMIKEFDLEIPEGTKIINPVGYLDFLQLEGGAKLILTDSGGLQEEGCILGVPCVTLRDNTERPETVDVGANIIAGMNGNIAKFVERMTASGISWDNPYGSGDAAKLTIDRIIGCQIYR